jgi:integrase
MQKSKVTVRVFQHRGIYHAEFSGGVRKSLKSRDKGEAMKNLDEIIRQLNYRIAEKTAPGKPTKLSEFMADYEKNRVGIAKMTIRKDNLSFRSLIDAVGDILISDLDIEEIDAFKMSCISRGTTPQTINGYLRHIKAALHVALDKELIVKIPKIKMVPEKKNRLSNRIIAPDDLKLILKTAMTNEPIFGTYLTIAAWTGCRRTEILGLQWQNINFKTKMMTVTGKGMGGGTDRDVPMMPPVVKILKPLKQDEGRVFPPWHPDTPTHKFVETVRACGVKARLHDLRHSAVTYMLKSGIPIQVVQKIVGHAELATTEIYTHVLNDVMKKEMAKLRFA